MEGTDDELGKDLRWVTYIGEGLEIRCRRGSLRALQRASHT